MIKKKQTGLFEKDEEHSWENEWQGMPEFIQKRDDPYAVINVRFRCKEDLDDFANLVGQPLNSRSKSIWYPRLKRGANSDKVYFDES